MVAALQFRDAKRLMPVGDAVPTDAAAASRVRKFIASDESVDSYNTVIKADGWVLDQYQRNPVVPLFHNTSSKFPVAKGSATVEGQQLIVSADFAPADDPVSGPDAEQSLLWIDRGVLGMSVGFNPLEYEYNEARETGDEWVDFFYPPLDYTRTELLEVSVVQLPANPNALPIGRAAREMSLRFARRTLPRLADRITLNMSREELDQLVADVTKSEVAQFRAAQAARKAAHLRGK